MTIEQVDEAIHARQAASTALHEQLRELENKKKHDMPARELGRMKHQIICRHRHRHLRKPFVCRKCWTYLPICVCPLFERKKFGKDTAPHSTEEKHKASLPNVVDRVVVWTHHEEWGRVSNTGSLLPIGLERTDMLMKGLPEHDLIMDGLLNRDDLTPVVLWPGVGGEANSTTVSELQSRFVERKQCVNIPDCGHSITNITSRGLLLISIEGTWNTARKMANRLPSNVLRLDLGEEVASNFSSPAMNRGVLYNSTYSTDIPSSTNRASLLAPLRHHGKGSSQGKTENISTLEATIVALLALGLSVEDAGRILQIARTKVERVVQYSGKDRFRRAND